VQTRKAGLMAALSSKAQEGQVVVVDRLFLRNKDARLVFEQLLRHHIGTIKAVDNHKVQPAWLRHEVLRALSAGVLQGLIGIMHASGRGLESVFDDETVVANIMRELDQEDADYGVMMSKTGARAAAL
jgi:hypothetical protein